MNEELEFLRYMVDRLEQARPPYMLTGSMAMMFYAVPRMTRDLKADLVVRGQSEFRQLEFTRRRTLAVGDLTVAVVSPEDLILSKLDWARDSASASQYQDVVQLLSAVPDLDFDYLEHWAGALGVLERLRELGRS